MSSDKTIVTARPGRVHICERLSPHSCHPMCRRLQPYARASRRSPPWGRAGASGRLRSSSPRRAPPASSRRPTRPSCASTARVMTACCAGVHTGHGWRWGAPPSVSTARRAQDGPMASGALGLGQAAVRTWLGSAHGAPNHAPLCTPVAGLEHATRSGAAAC